MTSMQPTKTARGLSLIELMLAISVTALVAGAISGMMTAVTTGLSTRQDSRTLMVRANAAQSRLSAYIAPSQSVLSAYDNTFVVWLNDDRESDTVHASEIRWLTFDDVAGTVTVQYVDFPDDWTQLAIEKADRQLASDADWKQALDALIGRDLINDMVLLDGLTAFSIMGNTDLRDSTQFCFDLTFETATGEQDVLVSAAIRQHNTPAR